MESDNTIVGVVHTVARCGYLPLEVTTLYYLHWCFIGRYGFIS